MKTLKRSPGLLWLMSCYQWHMSLERWFILSKAAATENLQQTYKQTNKQTNKQGLKGFFFKIIFHKDQKGWKCKFVGYTWLVTPDDGTHPWRVIFWWHAQCDVFYHCAKATMRQCNYNLCNAWWWWSAHDSEPQRIQNTGFHFSVSFEHWSGNSLIKGFVFSQVTLQGKGDWGEKQTSLSC